MVTCTHNGDWGLCSDCANTVYKFVETFFYCVSCNRDMGSIKQPSLYEGKALAPHDFPCADCAQKETTDVHQLLARGRVGDRVETGPVHGSGTAARPVHLPDEVGEHGQPRRRARTTMIHRLFHSILRRKRIRRCPVCRHLSANIVRPMSHAPRGTGRALRRRLFGEA